MTIAPPNLIAVRRLLLEHLDIHENSRAYRTDLDPDEVGIVGDANHRGGYHCGRNRLVRDDYSARTARDRAGLSDFASALDIGTFQHGPHNLRTFSVWLVRECESGAPDTRDIREVIYSPDGKTVRRWDRERRSTTGDDSHLYHTHISFYRDATKDGRDLSGVFRRFLAFIKLIKGEDTMPTVSEIWSGAFGRGEDRRTAGQLLVEARTSARDAVTKVDALAAKVDALAAEVSAPTPVTVSPETIAAALRDPATVSAIARALLTEYGRRVSS